MSEDLSEFIVCVFTGFGSQFLLKDHGGLDFRHTLKDASRQYCLGPAASNQVSLIVAYSAMPVSQVQSRKRVGVV